MSALNHILLLSSILFSTAFAVAAPDHKVPLETREQIFTRCGVDLNSPNAIADAAGAACRIVDVLASLQPKEDPRDNQ